MTARIARITTLLAPALMACCFGVWDPAPAPKPVERGPDDERKTAEWRASVTAFVKDAKTAVEGLKVDDAATRKREVVRVREALARIPGEPLGDPKEMEIVGKQTVIESNARTVVERIEAIAAKRDRDEPVDAKALRDVQHILAGIEADPFLRGDGEKD